jgi:hypothetical protein
MDEIRTDRRGFNRFLSLALTLIVALGLVATRAGAQSPSPAPTPTSTDAPAPSPPAQATPTPPAATPDATPAPTAPPPPAPTVATPPPPPTKEQLAEAKKFFENGKKLSKEGLYQEALASFLEANRISPRKSIQNEIARTYRFMKDMASAYVAYETLVANYGDQMKAAEKTDAQHALEELDILTGVVAIGIQEPGAHVLVDQKEIGLTPIAKPVRLNIATHQVTISKDGFDTITQTLDIRGHDSLAINGPLMKTVTTGHVSVEVKQTTPPDPTVLIFVDSSDAGPPPYAADLEPGLHTFEAKGDKDVAPIKQIQVDKKQTYSEILELHVKAGTIVVNVDVADTEISVDGNVVAHGVYEGPAPAGTHALVVKKTGYVDYKKDLIVDDGQRVVENVALQKEAVAAAPTEPKEHDYTGAYSQLALVGQFEVTKPSNDVSQGIGYTPSTTINTQGVAGGALNLRFGYSLGFVGIEGSFLLGYDHSESVVNMPAGSQTADHPGITPRTEDYVFHRLGGTAAIGARLMPKMQVFRPTLGVGVGASIKGIFYQRSISGITQPTFDGISTSDIPNLPSNPSFYVTPSLMIDGGIELGSTPGTRFYLGCLMVADFGSSGSASISPGASSNSSVVVGPPAVLHGVNGTDVFVGPILGLQFGE